MAKSARCGMYDGDYDDEWVGGSSGGGAAGGDGELVFVPDEMEGAMDLALLERRVLALRPQTPADAAAALMTQVNAAVDAAQRLRRMVWDQAFRWVEANGPLQVGVSRYYIGDKTVTECRDVTRAVNLILEACGGDLDQFCKCLASRPLKHGWCRGVLKGRWGEVFRVRVVTELKEDGTPRQYLKVDNGFGMGRRGGAAGGSEADTPDSVERSVR